MSERLAPDSRPSAVRIALAFFAIYVLWGTNYLAIRYALEGMPPLLMMGLRCLIAGMVLLALRRSPEMTRVCSPGMDHAAWQVE